MEEVQSDLFSETYGVARAKFLEAARRWEGARVESLPLGILGADNEELFIDIAWLGSQDPTTVILHSSGVHGIEGFAGSAIQTQYLRGTSGPLPDHVALVFVHVVNPYGMSRRRRYNENNVDLNRNCLADETKLKLKKNENYDVFAEFLAPSEEPWNWTTNYWMNAAYYLSLYGYNNVKQAIAGGQYHVPKGLNYGGSELQPGIQLVYKYLVDNFSNAAHYYVIDVHTGLGPKGYDSLLLDGGAAPEWLALLERGEVTTSAEGTAYVMYGAFAAGIKSLFCEGEDDGKFSFLNESEETIRARRSTTKTMHEVTQEFGTLPATVVLKALREENFYHQKMDVKNDHWSKQQLFESFRIPEKQWEQDVLTRGAQLLSKVLNSLNQ